MKYRILSIISFSLLVFGHTFGQSGKAIITEYTESLKTYSFGDPDPVPVLTSNPKIYPYHKIEGYTMEPVMQDWKIVKLENDYIEVYILPEVGGKIWGAIEKSTGEEFIYRNEVMKFRNISMRGPWTSGGIEFNFGIIGHHPSTATPVDYATKINEDGSVSCTVGNMDLPSHTQWRVEIYLEPDKAYFETRVLWNNPTHDSQPYYNWMTGAAVATDDLQFFSPGNQYLGHPGEEHPWPMDVEGRDLSKYSENNFGGSKSYHVVGEYNDFFGGYYHNKNFGFGHWSPYDEMPGQKLWIWALSRSGGIWEDLLTDADGQYIEFQAGRLLNQYSPSRQQTSISQVEFEPGRTDLWREIWFPVKEIGGLSDVSTKGILHIQERGDSLIIGLNALTKAEGILRVELGGKSIVEEALSMEPMEVKKISILKPDGDIDVTVDGMDLALMQKVGDRKLRRPFISREGKKEMDLTVGELYHFAEEKYEGRMYGDAMELLQKCLMKETEYLPALVMMADLKYRSALWDEAMEIIEKGLALDTYDPHANFVAGKVYAATGNAIDALEAFGWAARSMKYRADAYSAMAEIHMKAGRYDEASKFARSALDFNRFHFGARSILTVIARIDGNMGVAVRHLAGIRTLDPLNQFAKMEQFLVSGHAGDKEAYLANNRSEFAYQASLELAISYLRIGRDKDAVVVLELAPGHPLVDLWLAYLLREEDSSRAGKLMEKVENADADFVFPYRTETLEPLSWASSQSTGWKVNYYRALNIWGLGRNAEALSIMDAMGEKVHYAPLYISRAYLRKSADENPTPDLLHAVQIDKSNWRSWNALIEQSEKDGNPEKTFVICEEAYGRLKNNYVIQMKYVKSLIEIRRFSAAIDILKGMHVLPYEGAFVGRKLWEDAHQGASLEATRGGSNEKAIDLLIESQEWPENLGVGKPYDPDERISNYLLAYNYGQLGKIDEKEKYEEAVLNYKNERLDLTDVLRMKIAKNRKIDVGEISGNSSKKEVIDYLRAFDAGDLNALKTIEIENPDLFSSFTNELIKTAIDLP